VNGLVVRNIDAMVDEAVAALDAGGTTKFPLVDGRVVAVFATPNDASSQKMAMGISVLPSGYSTPAHHHPAEEFAMIVRGTGSITINGHIFPVGPGDVVVTPPDAIHVTTSRGDERLVVYWTYGPAGSEQRWLSEEKE
jgi:mannose-6-phosphate isomerase-like protein (cupin superfamily)